MRYLWKKKKKTSAFLNNEVTVLQDMLQHQHRHVIIDQGQLSTALFIIDTWWLSEKCLHQQCTVICPCWQWISMSAMFCSLRNLVTDCTSQVMAEWRRDAILRHFYCSVAVLACLCHIIDLITYQIFPAKHVYSKGEKPPGNLLSRCALYLRV